MSDENPVTPPEGSEPQQPATPPPAAPPAPEGQTYGQMPPPGMPEKASGKSVTAMVLGIIGIVLCQPVGVAAWIIGHQERKEIAAGRSPVAGQGMATAGWIMGIIGTIMLIFGILILGALLTLGIFSEGFFSSIDGGSFDGGNWEDF